MPGFLLLLLSSFLLLSLLLLLPGGVSLPPVFVQSPTVVLSTLLVLLTLLFPLFSLLSVLGDLPLKGVALGVVVVVPVGGLRACLFLRWDLGRVPSGVGDPVTFPVLRVAMAVGRVQMPGLWVDSGTLWAVRPP